MAFIPKKTQLSPYETTNMPVGIHAVKVQSIRYKRNKNNEIDTFKDKQPKAYKVVFVNDEMQTIVTHLYLSEAALWLLDKFCVAVGLDLTTQPDVNDVVGRELWIVVIREYQVSEEGGDRMLDNYGKEIYTDVVSPQFYKMISRAYPPTLTGDPKIPNGMFITEKVPFYAK